MAAHPCAARVPLIFRGALNAVPKILAETHEQVPIIIVLRNPIDRAYFHFLFNIRQGWESLGFEDAIQQEPLRKAENWPCGWHYTERGYHAKQVKAYTDVFSRVLILLFERDVITGPGQPHTFS